MTEHKKLYLKINGKQAVKLDKRATEYKSLYKQIPVAIKVYDDFECILKGIESNVGSRTKYYQDHIPWSFSYKLACVDNKLSKPIVLYKGENAAYKFIEAILEEYEYCKRVMKKHLNKNLIITEKEE